MVDGILKFNVGKSDCPALHITGSFHCCPLLHWAVWMWLLQTFELRALTLLFKYSSLYLLTWSYCVWNTQSSSFATWLYKESNWVGRILNYATLGLRGGDHALFQCNRKQVFLSSAFSCVCVICWHCGEWGLCKVKRTLFLLLLSLCCSIALAASSASELEIVLIDVNSL